jgi:hypothetical protein
LKPLFKVIYCFITIKFFSSLFSVMKLKLI